MGTFRQVCFIAFDSQDQFVPRACRKKIRKFTCREVTTVSHLIFACRVGKARSNTITVPLTMDRYTVHCISP